MKILIVDDDSVSRRILQRSVEAFGHACLVSSGGGEAWQLYQSHEPDVIISDWIMPGIDGLQLCAKVRELGRSSYTYFILVSSLTDKLHFLAGMLAGADDYLTKPLDRDELEVRLVVASRVTSLHRTMSDQNTKLGELLHAQEQLTVTLSRTAESRGRLAGVTLAAREIAHLLNNDLTLAMAAAEIVQNRSDVSPEVRRAISDMAAGLLAAAEHVRQFQQIVRVETRETPVGPSLDLTRSTARE